MTNAENGVAALRSDLQKHEQDSKEVKADVYSRLNTQDQTQKEVLQAVNDVKVDMAAIRGALGIPKATAK